VYFKDTLKFRNVWLGVAMIWIFLFHAGWNLSFFPLNFIRGQGFGGVDICLFASGIGCYYSLSSNSDAPSFMKRRLMRLMPTYLVFIVPWLIYMYLIGEFGYRMALGNIFAVQKLTGHKGVFNWYISAILVLYLLAPYFKALVDKASVFKNILFCVLLIIFSVPFWKTKLLIMITRLPIFYMGMFFGKICRSDSKMKLKHTVVLWAMFLLGVAMCLGIHFYAPQYRWSHGLYWYPFIFITPPMCIGISYLACLLEKVRGLKLLNSSFSIVGKYSFEVYLLHIPLVVIVPKIISRFSLQSVIPLVWAGSIVLLIASCFVLRRMAEFCVSLAFRKTKKNK